MNPRTLVLLAAAVFAAGCASFEKKPPPDDMGAAPPEEEIEEPGPGSSPDGVQPDNTPPDAPPAEPAAPPDPVPAEPVKPPDPVPAGPVKPPDPPRQEIPGSWTFTSAAGPGSAPVRHVDMEFGADGGWCGSMLVEVEGKRRFQALEGTWALADGKVTVTFADGRTRSWAVSWDGGTLVLRDGEAELRLSRQSR